MKEQRECDRDKLIPTEPNVLDKFIQDLKELEDCEYCEGTGFDSYPNHSTTYPVCPHCQE